MCARLCRRSYPPCDCGLLFRPLRAPAVGFQTPGGSSQPPSSASARSTLPQLASAIRLSSDYLERSCGPTGMFTYEVDTGSGRAAAAYNIIRHAGVMYALATLNRTHPDRRAEDTLVRSGTFLRAKYVGPDARSNGLAVWSRPLPAKSEADWAPQGSHWSRSPRFSKCRPPPSRLAIWKESDG